jgi:hypothetical protein
METHDTNKKRNLKIYKIALAFVVIILFLTYFSKSINDSLLTKVTAVSPMQGSLADRYQCTGTVIYKNTDKIFSRGNWIVKKVNVIVNQNIKKGDVMAIIDNSNILIEQKKLMLDMTKLQGDITNLKKSNADKNVLAEKEEELSIAKLQYDSFSNGVTNSGEIIASKDCKVSAVNIENGSEVESNQILFETVDISPKYSIVSELSSDEAVNYNIGDSIKAIIKTRKSNMAEEKKNKDNSLSLDLNVSNKQYLKDKNIYNISADIDSNEVSLEQGQSVIVSLSKTSKSYQCIVPKKCLSEESGQSYIYVISSRDGILGKELYVKKHSVEVIDSNDYNCAINLDINDFSKVVLDSSKPLNDEMSVALR